MRSAARPVGAASAIRGGASAVWARRSNRLIGHRRPAVETTFATLKRRMGLTAIRYRGLAKASGQVLVAAMAFNLRRWAALSTG